MRYVYQGQWEETVTAGHSKRVISDPVPAGWLLQVHYCYFHVPEAAINDVLTLYMELGGQELVLRSRARDRAKQGMSCVLPFCLGEHRRIIAEALEADNGDHLCLSLCGSMVELKKWKKGKV